MARRARRIAWLYPADGNATRRDATYRIVSYRRSPASGRAPAVDGHGPKGRDAAINLTDAGRGGRP